MINPFKTKIFPSIAFIFALSGPVTIYCFRQHYLGHHFFYYWILPAAVLGLGALSSTQLKDAISNLKGFLLPFLPWLLVCCLLPFLQPSHYRPEQQLLPLLGAICLFLCLHPYRLSKQTIICVCALSNFFISTTILWFFCHKGAGAPVFTGDFFKINSNCLLGGLLILLPLSFVGVFVYWSRNRCLSVLCLLSTCLGLLGVAFLQARTGLISLLSLLLFFFFLPKKNRMQFLFLLGTILCILILYFVYTGRLELGLQNIQDWCNGKANTSWGVRLTLWKTAILGLSEHPLVGWGRDPLGQILAAKITQLPFVWSGSTHFHSDFFHMLASFGLIGTSAWIVTQILLIRLCRNDPFRLIMLVALLLGGLSEVYWPFCKYSCITFYILWTLLTLADHSTGKVQL